VPIPKPDTQDGFRIALTHRVLPIALLLAREAVLERFRPLLKSLDVSEQQWRVLRVLYEFGSADGTLLAERACILAPSLSRIVKTLNGRGLIVTARDPQDARRMIVTLSEAGRDFVIDGLRQSRVVYEEIEAKVGSERIQHILDELEAVQQILRGDRSEAETEDQAEEEA